MLEISCTGSNLISMSLLSYLLFVRDSQFNFQECMRGARIFLSGGGGGGGPGPENSLDNVFFSFFLPFSHQLILQCTEGVQWFYYRVN